jgi:hypothetical protein
MFSAHSFLYIECSLTGLHLIFLLSLDFHSTYAELPVSIRLKLTILTTNHDLLDT